MYRPHCHRNRQFLVLTTQIAFLMTGVTKHQFSQISSRLSSLRNKVSYRRNVVIVHDFVDQSPVLYPTIGTFNYPANLGDQPWHVWFVSWMLWCTFFQIGWHFNRRPCILRNSVASLKPRSPIATPHCHRNRQFLVLTTQIAFLMRTTTVWPESQNISFHRYLADCRHYATHPSYP
jgi:hypothetical protein